MFMNIYKNNYKYYEYQKRLIHNAVILSENYEKNHAFSDKVSFKVVCP